MAYGKFIDGYYPAEEEAFKLARKSLVTSCFIKKGTIVSKEMLTAKRPGTGIYPENSEFIIGRVANKDIEEDTTLSLDMF
jgi:sialic acid synthase SpsE